MELETTKPNQFNLVSKILDKYRIRQAVLLGSDICIIIIGFLLSYNLVESTEVSSINNSITPIIICILSTLIMFYLFRCYSSLWRYAGIEELLSIFTACIISTIPCVIIHKIIGINYSLLFYIVNNILIISFTGGLRIAYRSARRISNITNSKEKSSKVLIIGAGHAGEMVIREIKNNPQINKQIVGIIDDDVNKLGRRIHGVRILGTTNEIEEIVKSKNIDEIILAMANVSKKRKREIDF